MSCSHHICLDCADNLVDQGLVYSCPGCGILLIEKLGQLFEQAMSNPMTRLSYCYEFSEGDRVWCYGGNQHNWLYSKEHCDLINEGYDEDGDDPYFVNIDIDVNGNVITYVIDVTNGEQYPENAPQKVRPVTNFILDRENLALHKIIGVAGTKL